MTSSTTIRLDDKLKEEASLLASQLGLSLNAVVTAYLKKFVKEKKIEFSLSDTDKERYTAKNSIDFGEEGVPAKEVVSFIDGTT